jgi:hypothetical protein
MKALTIVDALSNDRPPEKRKVDSSILSLTTTDRHAGSLRHLRFACY